MVHLSVHFLVTGASRGLGQAVAIAAAKYYLHRCKLHEYSSVVLRFYLVARSSSGLASTTSVIESAVAELQQESKAFRLHVRSYSIDMAKLDELDGALEEILQDLSSPIITSLHDDDVDIRHRIFCINNAGSLGHLGPCISSPSVQDMRETIDLNVTSCLWTSIRFAKRIKRLQQQVLQSAHSTIVLEAAVIVNISSLVAISDDFVTMGIYSAGKGAREKYHTILANEESTSQDSRGVSIKTLNYAPGPLETEMTQQIRKAADLDTSLKTNFEKTLLNVNDSAMKLIRLLDANEFVSGAHIDYYDLPENDTIIV